MSEVQHTHDCTGPDATCPCGFVFRVPPIHVSIEVFDGRVTLVNDAFNCEAVSVAIAALERAIARLRARR